VAVGADGSTAEDLGGVRVLRRWAGLPRTDLTRPVSGYALVDDCRILCEQGDDPLDVAARVEDEVSDDHVWKTGGHGVAGVTESMSNRRCFPNARRVPEDSGPGLTRRCVRLHLPLVATNQVDGLAALGDPTRRAIFERLADRRRAVGELARELPVSRPAVSQHLRVLKDAGLVTDRRAGNRRLYQLDPEGVGALRAYLDQFWNRALTAFKAAVEQADEEVS
jgi:DNA-binding transcriptional ArsR family regulator